MPCLCRFARPKAPRVARNYALELCQDDVSLALRLHPTAAAPTPEQPSTKISAEQRIEQALNNASTPMTRRQLRDTCRIRNATLGQAIATLVAAGRVLETDAGLHLATRRPS